MPATGTDKSVVTISSVEGEISRQTAHCNWYANYFENPYPFPYVNWVSLVKTHIQFGCQNRWSCSIRFSYVQSVHYHFVHLPQTVCDRLITVSLSISLEYTCYRLARAYTQLLKTYCLPAKSKCLPAANLQIDIPGFSLRNAEAKQHVCKSVFNSDHINIRRFRTCIAHVEWDGGWHRTKSLHQCNIWAWLSADTASPAQTLCAYCIYASGTTYTAW